MTKRDTGTQQLIKDTAKRIFFSEGKLHATTQDIADAAGVNRTLLNYYFRSRDILFEQVATEARAEMTAIMDQAMKFPYRELYVVTEFNRVQTTVAEEKKTKLNTFLNEISVEMKTGKIKQMDPRQFCMNLFALMAYPLITSCLNKSIYNISDADYLKLMEERKQLIFDIIYQ